MGEFNLGEVLRDQLKGTGADASQLDTSQDSAREQIEYIPLGRIAGDPNNFYDLSGLDELAANIELMGLQQPLRVRTDPQNPDRVIVVSGHRRRAALEKLAAEGRDEFQEVPCIRDRGAGSPALQELRLIYANSDTRVLTSAELSRQAERVEQLLYQLKEEGLDFPGRMRDHVAQAVKVSKTKLARLKVIRENLIELLAKFYAKNELNESCAYALAQQSAGVQGLVYKYLGGAKEVRYWTEWSVSDAIKKIKAVGERTCRRKAGEPACEHQEARLEKLFDGKYSYKPCDRVCCDRCENLASCKSACPLLAEKVKKLRSDKAAQNKQEKLARQERDRPEVEAISAFWKREAAARAAAGKSVRELFEATETFYSEENEKTWLEREALQTIKRGDTLPFGMYGLSLEDARKLVATADLLGVTTDFLLGRTDVPGGNVSKLDTSVPEAEGDEEDERVIRRVRWESRGRTPPERRLILTCALGPDGPGYRAVVWTGSEFKDLNSKEVLPNFRYTGWLELPSPGTLEDILLPSSECQPVRSGWMPGGTFPREPCEVAADFQVGDGDKPDVSLRRICWFDGADFLFRRHGPKVDAECIRWMVLPPVAAAQPSAALPPYGCGVPPAGNVSNLDTTGEART